MLQIMLPRVPTCPHVSPGVPMCPHVSPIVPWSPPRVPTCPSVLVLASNHDDLAKLPWNLFSHFTPQLVCAAQKFSCGSFSNLQISKCNGKWGGWTQVSRDEVFFSLGHCSEALWCILTASRSRLDIMTPTSPPCWDTIQYYKTRILLLLRKNKRNGLSSFMNTIIAKYII